MIMKKMNVGASMKSFPRNPVPRMMMTPPKHRTMRIMIEPRNSLTGWARTWRVLTLLYLRRILSVTESKRASIFFSALKALIIRSPPRVSSICDIVSLQSD